LNLADGGEGGIAIYGDANPSKRPEVRKKISERNPSRRPEVRQQISASKVGDKNPMKRPEQRQRMSQHNPMYNPEVLERNAASKRGKKNSPHTRALISIGNLGKHPLPADSQCPHCGFRSNRMVIARWHMGNI
jgi:hypothetical protein